ncbi:hypothetical protein BDK51DRAFT_31449 [Blyttiomyces helicus]|uniref:Uncharacterized protein n=1 Tax=Blyttiomyces helicus TaxID=388810 RepID=A0A4P9VZQ7_9FUNG|nr:hypothetical protein BDK51DRAFT_31449 [Blyttiomyces helicus]|eukprot:RKO84832.1 hypothetical protein BDK51DRAFT_31449 [Blyttiomyces helicus]
MFLTRPNFAESYLPPSPPASMKTRLGSGSLLDRPTSRERGEGSLEPGDKVPSGASPREPAETRTDTDDGSRRDTPEESDVEGKAGRRGRKGLLKRSKSMHKMSDSVGLSKAKGRSTIVSAQDESLSTFLASSPSSPVSLSESKPAKKTIAGSLISSLQNLKRRVGHDAADSSLDDGSAMGLSGVGLSDAGSKQNSNGTTPVGSTRALQQ